MKIAIIGDKKFSDKQLLARKLYEIFGEYRDVEFVTPNVTDVEKWTYNFATNHKIEVLDFNTFPDDLDQILLFIKEPNHMLVNMGINAFNKKINLKVYFQKT